MTRLASTIAALGVIAGAVVWPIDHFQSKADAEEARKEQKQALSKTAADLSIQILMDRIQFLNDKTKLTKAEQTELDLKLEQVKELQAEKAKQDSK